MQKIGDVTNTADSNGEFTNGNVAAGVPPTLLEAQWFNSVQREIINALAAAGIQPNKNNDAQLSEAIRKLISSGALEKSRNGADIPNKSEFVKNLGLTAGSALPVGVPIPWPLETPPAGWMKCNGATFTAAQYPELARVYPSLRLPDLRGEFIRGWDDGRGIDDGRELLSWQDDSFRAHDHGITAFDAWNPTVLTPNDRLGDALLSTDNAIGRGGDQNGTVNNRYQTRNGGGNETRPRNIAFNYIVRAV